MEQGLAKVVTLDSDSEDELEILSESIPNYGNYSTLVEIAPELQEKIRLCLEKRASLPGKIKTMEVYATTRSSRVMGSVRASFRPPGGQPSKTINVGASINDLFSSQVRGGGNNNSKKPEIATASDSAKQVQTVQIRFQQPLPVGADQRVTERPSTPSSPVILFSPIRKGKTAKSTDILDRPLPTLRFQQTVTHPPQNSTPPLDSWKKNISQCLDGEKDSQESSKTEMKTSFKVKKNIPKVKYDLSLRDLDFNDAVFKNVCAKVTPVELSPMRFSSDDDDEEFMEDSILGICNSPVPPPQNYEGPLLDLKQKSPFGKVNSKDYANVNEDSKDLAVNEDTLQNMPMHLVKEMWEKMNEDENISKQQYVYEKENKMNEEEESYLENLITQDEQDYEGESGLYNETETDVYYEEQCSNFGSEKQNSNDKFLMSKYVKINVETLPKNLLGSSTRSENESCLKVKSNKDGPPLWSTNDGSSPPLWSTNDSSGPPLWSTKDGSGPPLWSTNDGSAPPLWSTNDGSSPPLWSTNDGSGPPLWSTKDGSSPPLWSTNDGSGPPLWSTKNGSGPPLWSTIFPPSPPSPPPARWMNSTALWELDAGGFEAITGLCSHQTAHDLIRKINAPKPRVLRKRRKN